MATLYDYLGRPVETRALLREEATPSLTGVRTILADHPTRGLTPQRLAAILLDAEQGDATRYLEMAEDIADEFGVVESAEDFADHGLLIGGEEPADARGRDVPVGVDFRAQCVVKRKRNRIFLLGRETLVKLRNQRFGNRLVAGS